MSESASPLRMSAHLAERWQAPRGEGDGEAIKIYADSFGQDAEFFAFYRSMEAYRKSIGNSDTSMVLSPDSSFFRFFKDKSGDAQK